MINRIGGMSLDDITWIYDSKYPHPETLSIFFKPLMKPGAYFTFGADTDLLVSDPCPGWNFGDALVEARVVLQNGDFENKTFEASSAVRSEVV